MIVNRSANREGIGNDNNPVRSLDNQERQTTNGSQSERNLLRETRSWVAHSTQTVYVGDDIV